MKRITSDNYDSIVYVSHPYGGKKENEEKVSNILKELQSEYPNRLFISPIHAFSWVYSSINYEKGMEMCFWLLENCDEMLILSADWKTSEGCKREVEYCNEVGIPVHHLTPEGNLVDFLQSGTKLYDHWAGHGCVETPEEYPCGICKYEDKFTYEYPCMECKYNPKYDKKDDNH